jgi:hypothetical protein
MTKKMEKENKNIKMGIFMMETGFKVKLLIIINKFRFKTRFWNLLLGKR